MIPQHQQDLLGTLDFKFPKEYLDYLSAAGSTFEFGGAYLIEANELLEFNANYKADEFYPGYFLIGADGGGEAFAIEKVTGEFIRTPFVGHDEETPVPIGRIWKDFLEYLQSECV
ncbi:MAG TPA: SMI1/KNR4 family protein [Hymenobacter sp.]